ncbi:phage neck terminator protein [Paenibacillus sp. FA6]|uniref:phage neck terminator protein n=1 Tax=Paenibacillus sp. FA6 TaxID=3413029 RepID=UPI003F65C9C8
MLALEGIRTVIIAGLSTHVGKEVMVTNGTGDNPEGALLTCDFSDVFHNSRGFPVVMQVGNKLVKTETVHFTMTFLSFDDDKAIRTQNAWTAREWFKSEGHVELKEKVNVVVAKVGSVSNRDIQNGTVWERREGFDVEFRTLDILESDLEWIEQTKIQRS